MKITLEIKPLSSNRAWQGRRFKTDDHVRFEQDVSFLLVPYSNTPPSGLLEVHYEFHLVNHKTMDYDNCIKTLQDVLVKRGIIHDDRFIYRAVIDKFPSTHDFVVIEILPLKREETPAEAEVSDQVTEHAEATEATGTRGGSVRTRSQRAGVGASSTTRRRRSVRGAVRPRTYRRP